MMVKLSGSCRSKGVWLIIRGHGELELDYLIDWLSVKVTVMIIIRHISGLFIVNSFCCAQ